MVANVFSLVVLKVSSGSRNDLLVFLRVGSFLEDPFFLLCILYLIFIHILKFNQFFKLLPFPNCHILQMLILQRKKEHLLEDMEQKIKLSKQITGQQYLVISILMGNYIQGLNSGSNSQPYYQSAAIVIIVANSISFLALVFVVAIYIINWRTIASFPMRLVVLPLSVLPRPESLRHLAQSHHHS